WCRSTLPAHARRHGSYAVASPDSPGGILNHIAIPSVAAYRQRSTKDERTTWALANGWQLISGHPSLTKPSRPKEAIVRLVFKETVVNLEVKKPAGKWEKVAGQSYARVHADPDTALPLGLGLETIPGFTMLMRDNKDRMACAAMGGMSRS